MSNSYADECGRRAAAGLQATCTHTDTSASRMVHRYTEEELISYEAGACLPENVDLAPFLTMVETVTELLKAQGGDVFGRRKSFNHLKKKKLPKEIVDEDGWVSLVTNRNEDETEGAEGESAVAVEEDDGFSEPVKKGKQHTMKIKTNASKISSGKSSVGDARDTIAITQTSKFNAFDALAMVDDE